MNKESREHLSCLMDGEISAETGRFLVRRLGADEQLCATWARYHLVRDCLRHQDGAWAGESLADRVQQAIQGEGLPAAPHKVRRTWLRPVAGLAVAASVALMAIVAVGPQSGTTPATGEGLVQRGEELPAFSSPQSLTPAPVSQQASLNGQSASNSRMGAYLLRHYQATGATGRKGFVTFVPIVINPGSDENGASQRIEVSSQESDEDRTAPPQ